MTANATATRQPAPMSATAIEQTADRVVIDVDHDPRQSYRRTVDPYAMRAVRRWLAPGRRWALTDTDYDIEHPDPARARSRYTFTTH